MLVRQLPPNSAVHVAVHGPAASWTVSDYLAAAQVDLLAGANWQRAGGKGRRPKPIDRPGAQPANRQRMGTQSIPLDEIKDRLANWGTDGG